MKRFKIALLILLILTTTALTQDAYWVLDDHGELYGLSDDDHTQYLLATGSRNLAGDWNLGGYDLTNGGSFAGVGPIKISGSAVIELQAVQDTWLFKYADGLGGDNTGMFINLATGTIEYRMLNTSIIDVNVITKDVHHYNNLQVDGDITVGADSLDPTINFNGANNDGRIRWKDIENYFLYPDDLFLANQIKIMFNDSATYINSSASAVMDLYAGNGIKLHDNITIGDGDAGVDYSLTFDGQDSNGKLTWMEDEGWFVSDAPITLPGDPTQDLQAATKQYVDNASPSVSLITIITIPAGAMILAHDTNFAPVETLTGSNISRFAHSFDYQTTEYGRVELTMPSDLDTSGSVTFTFYWRPRVHPDPAQDVVWKIESIAVADGESWDQAFVSKSTVTGTSKVTINQISVTTDTVSVADLGWEAGDTVPIRLSRDADNEDDTLHNAATTDDDALLLAVRIEVPRQ